MQCNLLAYFFALLFVKLRKPGQIAQWSNWVGNSMCYCVGALA